MPLPYDLYTRCTTLQKAAALAQKIHFEGFAESLEWRIQELREGTCEHLNAIAPDILYTCNRWNELEAAQIEDLAEHPDLQMEWTPVIRSLCWLICVADSENLKDSEAMLVEQMIALHPASAFLAVPGFHFHFTGQPIPIDASGLMDVLHAHTEAHPEEGRIDMDKQMTFFLQNTQRTGAPSAESVLTEGWHGLLLHCHFIDAESSEPRTMLISFPDLYVLAHSVGQLEAFEALKDEIEFRFGV